MENNKNIQERGNNGENKVSWLGRIRVAVFVLVGVIIGILLICSRYFDNVNRIIINN